MITHKFNFNNTRRSILICKIKVYLRDLTQMHKKILLLAEKSKRTWLRHEIPERTEVKYGGGFSSRDPWTPVGKLIRAFSCQLWPL